MSSRDSCCAASLTCASTTAEDGTLSIDGLVYVVGEYRRMTAVPQDPLQQLKVCLAVQWHSRAICDTSCLQSVIECIYEHSLLPRVAADLHEPAGGRTLGRHSSREVAEHANRGRCTRWCRYSRISC